MRGDLKIFLLFLSLTALVQAIPLPQNPPKPDSKLNCTGITTNNKEKLELFKEVQDYYLDQNYNISQKIERIEKTLMAHEFQTNHPELNITKAAITILADFVTTDTEHLVEERAKDLWEIKEYTGETDPNPELTRAALDLILRTSDFLMNTVLKSLDPEQKKLLQKGIRTVTLLPDYHLLGAEGRKELVEKTAQCFAQSWKKL